MPKNKLPQNFLDLLKTVKAKRPRTVIEHILKHGVITTEELESKYGYAHAPRAARDVRELGIPLETIRVKNSEGRTIAAYRFGDLQKVRADTLEGRKVFSKAFKESLISKNGCRCFICLGNFEDRYLQIDHRVPYEVCGDQGTCERKAEDYMLICGSCNRAKSWSCEHCLNWLEEKSTLLCQTCYWAIPENYKHIALKALRRVDIVWSGNEIKLYEKLKDRAQTLGKNIPDYVKSIIHDHVDW
ncbi:MAG: HNH endonuclease signature motif containing protein [Phycisphaerae bacterium]